MLPCNINVDLSPVRLCVRVLCECVCVLCCVLWQTVNCHKKKLGPSEAAADNDCTGHRETIITVLTPLETVTDDITHTQTRIIHTLKWPDCSASTFGFVNIKEGLERPLKIVNLRRQQELESSSGNFRNRK